MKHISASQMKEIDRRAQEEFNIPGLFLMENAGIKTVDVIIELLKNENLNKVFVFCGPGNNGGDGFVIARYLINRGINTKILLLVDPIKIKGDALTNYNRLLSSNRDIILKDEGCFNLVIEKTDLIVDAIFGIGLTRSVGGSYFRTIDYINRSKAMIISVDTPSGLCATTGRVLGIGVKADYTVTFGLAKNGFFINNGPVHVGELTIADIGLPLKLLE